MARDITATLYGALNERVTFPAFLFDMETSLGNVRAWSGIGNIEFNGKIFLGVGHMGRLDIADETDELRATNVKAELSGIPLALISTVLGGDYHLRPLDIWLGNADSLTGKLEAAFLLFGGKVDTVSIQEEAETATIIVIAESDLADLQKPRTWRYSDADQQHLYPGDLGLEFVATLAEKQITWGRPQQPEGK